jgi:hypothetical protein
MKFTLSLNLFLSLINNFIGNLAKKYIYLEIIR